MLSEIFIGIVTSSKPNIFHLLKQGWKPMDNSTISQDTELNCIWNLEICKIRKAGNKKLVSSVKSIRCGVRTPDQVLTMTLAGDLEQVPQSFHGTLRLGICIYIYIFFNKGYERSIYLKYHQGIALAVSHLEFHD